MPRRLALAALLLAALAPASRAHAELPASLTVGESTLTLNGAGSRSKYLMTMYEAGLYLARPTADGAQVIAADEPMVVRLEIVSGMVTEEKLVESLNEGFAKSTGGAVAPIQKEIAQFRACFAQGVAKGDVFDFVYAPDQGVAVHKNGACVDAIAGLPFKRALFGVWLSNDPVDKDLKTALLTPRNGRR